MKKAYSIEVWAGIDKDTQKTVYQLYVKRGTELAKHIANFNDLDSVKTFVQAFRHPKTMNLTMIHEKYDSEIDLDNGSENS